MLECNRTDVSGGIDVNKQIYQKNVIFGNIVILKILVWNMRSIFAMFVMI